MWVLIFVVANSHYSDSGATSVVQEFMSKDKCMTAQISLVEQANARKSFVLANICAPK